MCLISIVSIEVMDWMMRVLASLPTARAVLSQTLHSHYLTVKDALGFLGPREF